MFKCYQSYELFYLACWSLYKTEAYLDEHLAIFHSSYVDKCVEKGDIKKVALGKYFLPPLELQKGTYCSMISDGHCVLLVMMRCN